jgi:hypothetical protein
MLAARPPYDAKLGYPAALDYTWDPREVWPGSGFAQVRLRRRPGAAYLDAHHRLRGERCEQCGAVTDVLVERTGALSGQTHGFWRCERHLEDCLPPVAE